MAGNSDFWSWLSLGSITVPINCAASGDNTIFTATAGRRFCAFHLWLQAELAVDVTIKSGSTALTAPITFAADAEKEWKNSAAPVFIGRAVGNNLVLNLSGAIQVNGFVTLMEMTA